MTLLATTMPPEMAVSTHTKPTIAEPGNIVIELLLIENQEISMCKMITQPCRGRA
jgi:hypothetical protein